MSEESKKTAEEKPKSTFNDDDMGDRDGPNADRDLPSVTSKSIKKTVSDEKTDDRGGPNADRGG